MPADKAVEGFSWSGFDANFSPTVQPPVYAFDQLLAEQAPGMTIVQVIALVLLGAGLIALAWYVWRRRRRTAR